MGADKTIVREPRSARRRALIGEAETSRSRGLDGLDDVYTRAVDARRMREVFREAMESAATPRSEAHPSGEKRR